MLAIPLVLLTAVPAGAAMWLRIEIAQPAVAGVPAALKLTTLVMYTHDCIGDPGALPVPNGVWHSFADASPSESTFKLVAYPAGRRDAAMPVPLTHRAVDSPFWDGSITLPTPGSWTVRMAEPDWGTAESERCAGARIDVMVAPAAAERGADGWLAAAGAVVLASVIGLVAWRVRRGPAAPNA